VLKFRHWYLGTRYRNRNSDVGIGIPMPESKFRFRNLNQNRKSKLEPKSQSDFNIKISTKLGRNFVLISKPKFRFRHRNLHEIRIEFRQNFNFVASKIITFVETLPVRYQAYGQISILCILNNTIATVCYAAKQNTRDF
jgi:hypothetical protein